MLTRSANVTGAAPQGRGLGVSVRGEGHGGAAAPEGDTSGRGVARARGSGGRGMEGKGQARTASSASVTPVGGDNGDVMEVDTGVEMHEGFRRENGEAGQAGVGAGSVAATAVNGNGNSGVKRLHEDSPLVPEEISAGDVAVLNNHRSEVSGIGRWLDSLVR